ncbi:hypothetical protein MKW94_015157 [Papaver nudicaule]|uniref:Uncharacterized protein n=1 Tax=Papaver nudicaule TaxID=74823 RepID=A0AA42AYX6_PAPNU|nr:hypothetical protein [Papaver nudicaule]MCL7050183.1 hypothetical protein [Papaver nudicaule]
MASSDKDVPEGMQSFDTPPSVPGKPMSVGQHMLDKGAAMLQSLKPIKMMQQHVCTFALYSHDMSRQIETHHFVTRINQEFLQCAVYDSDSPSARLIGVEYIVSDGVFETLPAEEQKLVPEMVQTAELGNLTKTYGKFWCTWQTDRGDVLPLGAPSLMMSPQGVPTGMVKPDLLQKRDEKYNISSEDLKKLRVEIAEPEWINPNADIWKKTGKGFAVDVEKTEMKCTVPFP